MKVYEIHPFGRIMFVKAKSKSDIKQAFDNKTFPIYIRKDIDPKSVTGAIIEQCGHKVWIAK